MKRLLGAFRYAAAGVAWAWQRERNFRIETIIGFLAVLLGIYLEVSLAPIVLACALVLSLELLNSALEATIDLISPGYHPLAKRAKDLSAAAVMLAAIGAALVGLLVLGPPLWTRLFG